jgi:prephenate dehydrogenase
MDDSGFKSSRILVAGLGLIGGSVAKALKGAGFAPVDAYDMDLKALAQAKKDGVIRQGIAALRSEEYDLILCCLPPRSVSAFYELAKPHLSPGGVFAELSGLKKTVTARLAALCAAAMNCCACIPWQAAKRRGMRIPTPPCFPARR